MIVPLIQLLHLILLWVLPFHPYPELFVYPYLTSHGFLPYANILDQHFPGLMFFPVNFYSLGFTSPESFKLLLLLNVTLQSAFIYKIAKSFSNQRVAIVASIFFLLWQPFFDGNQLWLDSFLPLFILPAFYFFFTQKWTRLGLLIGMAIVFKQTQIPLAIIIALYILVSQKQNRWKVLFSYSLTGIIAPLLMLIYFWKIGVISDFFFWTVKFNITTFAHGGSIAPTLGQVARLSLPAAMLSMSLFVKKYSKLARISTIWAITAIVGGIARFEFLHLLPAVPFFCISAGILIHNWLEANKKPYVYLLIMLTSVWMAHFYFRQHGYLTTRYFEPEVVQTVDYIKAHTQPGDKVFLLGLHPHIYPLSQTIPSGKLFVFQFPWFLQVAGDRVLSSLQTDPPKLIAYDSSSLTDGQYLKDYAWYLVQYIQSRYKETDHIGSITFYESRY